LLGRKDAMGVKFSSSGMASGVPVVTTSSDPGLASDNTR
jgi:hypothetical protein